MKQRFKPHLNQSVLKCIRTIREGDEFMLRKLIALSLLLCFIPFCLGVAEPVTLSTSEAWRESMINYFDSLEIDLTFTKEALGAPYPDGWEIYRAKSDDEDWLLPVSYTHLDVYKRQISDRIKTKLDYQLAKTR